MFRQYPIQLQLFARQIVAILPRSYEIKKVRTLPNIKSTKDNEITFHTELNESFFSKNLGSTNVKWHAILSKHPELKSLRSKDVINTIHALKQFNFTLDDILSKPMILHTNEHTLGNRYSVLKECGVENITISLLAKYVTVMNRSVTTLKSFGHIPYDLDVIQQLLRTFTDIQVKIDTNYICNESLELKKLRQHILNYYLQQRIGMTLEEIERLWITYSRLKHKSFRSVQNMVELLLDVLKFPKERIIKNAFMLCGDADNVRRIINEIPAIHGQDIKDILFKKPKIMMSSCDALLATLQHIKSFGISEDAVIKCTEVLTLGPGTVLERLKDLNEIEEFQALNTNPRVLRLVLYQNKARLRLDYLNQIKVRCTSLHILSCASKAFAKFVREGSDSTKGRDIIVYLFNKMKQPEKDVRNILSRHPNWCHIPILQVKQCYEFLLENKFTNDEIYKNLHLILYPIKRIEEKLQQLQTPEFMEKFNIKESYNSLENRKILTLVLYLIERENHFTGDGVWTDQHIQHVENFTNLLPGFPESTNKVYKYGTTPTGTAKVTNVSA